jgi:hypothetical protein
VLTQTDCDYCAMCLAPVTSAVFLIVVILVISGRLRGVSEMPLLPHQG